MSTNIKHQPVNSPVVFSLKRMAQHSPSRNGTKGSYMLFDPQQNADGLSLEKKANSIGGSAPGSPGSMQDFEQAVLKLQQEIEESHRKGSELEQIIADFSGHNISQSVRVPDTQALEGSSSGDSVGENVKDAHIKHLQRQVTVLQASLYKCEGWANRVSEALKERDKALDDVTRLTNETKVLQEDNQQLQKKVEELSCHLQDTQRSLKQVTEELQSQVYNGQMVTQLQEDVYRQKCEIAALKESLRCLTHENKSLKDSGIETNSQPLGSVACSQELEHLHLVVDRLKDTVLEQRSYLLHLKKPNMRNIKSQCSPAGTATTGGLLDVSANMSRKLSSPTLRSVGFPSTCSDIAAGSLSGQTALGQSNWAASLKAADVKDSFLETKQPLCRNVSGPDVNQQVVIGLRKKQSPHDLLDNVFNLDISPAEVFHKDGDSSTGFQLHNTSPMIGSTFTVPKLKQKPSPFLRQIGSENVGKMSNSPPVDAFAPGAALQHRTTQSEILAQKRKVIPDKGSKSEVIARQSRDHSPANKIAAQSYAPGTGVADTFSQVSPGLTQGQRNLLTISPHQEYYVGNVVPTEVQRQYALNGKTSPNMFNQTDMVEYENMNRNSPTFQPQRIYHPPSSSKDGPVNIHNHSKLCGSTTSAPAPTAHSTAVQGSNREVVYINTPSAHGSCTTTTTTPQMTSPADHVSPRPRLGSDKLCPVCTSDFSQMSMEDFQTHVFECIDDQNQPETMKPQTPDKVCPMCNAKFGPETTQEHYEMHVHSHFGEEEPFIIVSS